MKKTLILIKKHRSVNNLIPFFIILFLIPFYALLYKIFSVRALSFGCFDDCANYVTGYFVLHGKKLYTEIFFNHIMGMTYLSFLIQKFHHSVNIYDLVLTHRKVIIAISFIFDFYIIRRFKWAGFFFVVLYELSKFYTFGDRFLAESVVIYAAVILVGFVMEIKHGKILSTLDYIATGLLSFFIIFMREPYIPLSLFLFIIILLTKQKQRNKVVSLVILVSLLSLTLINTDIPAFLFNDLSANMQTAIRGEVGQHKLLGMGLFPVFIYPIYLLFSGKWNPFHFYLISISVVFLISFFLRIKKTKNYTLGLIVVSILGLSNLRYTVPGQTFYEAYHMQVFIGIFLFTTLYFVMNLTYFKMKFILYGIVLFAWGFLIINPRSYFFDKHDLQVDLLTNFGKEMNIGTVIHNLSSPSDTLFLDGADDLIYWQADLKPSYKYSWYTAIMPQILVYRDARIEMFKKNPPDFYYDFCSPKAPEHPSLPKFIKNSYQQLYENGKKSCLYIKKTKLQEITSEQWDKARQGFFTLPPSKK